MRMKYGPIPKTCFYACSWVWRTRFTLILILLVGEVCQHRFVPKQLNGHNIENCPSFLRTSLANSLENSGLISGPVSTLFICSFSVLISHILP